MITAIRRRLREPAGPSRICLMALLVLAPTLFDLGATRPFDIPKTTVVHFFAWLAFGLWLVSVLRGRARPRRFLLAYLVAALIVVNGIATLLATARLTAFFGWYGRYNGLLTLIIYALIFYVVACVYREPDRDPAELVWAMGVASVVLTTYLWVQRLGVDPIAWAQPTGNPIFFAQFGTMGNSSFAGAYLAMTSPWLYLALRRSRTRLARIGVGLLTVYVLLGIWYTSSRSGFIALLAVAAALVWVHRRGIPLVIKLGLIACVIAAGALAVIVVWHPGSDEVPARLQRVDVLRSQTVRVRGHWWLAGLKMFRDKPVLGWGPESYGAVYSRYLLRDAIPLKDAEIADNPHNIFITHLVSAGAVGLLAYLAVLLVAFQRGLRRSRDGPDRPVVATAVALLAGYIGQGSFSIDVTAVAVVPWVAIGIIAARADPPAPIPDVRPPRYERRRAAAIVALATMLVAALSTTALKADHEAHTARRLAVQQRSVGEVVGHFRKALMWDPVEPFLRQYVGEYYERIAAEETDRSTKRAYLRRAVEHYTAMDRLQPGYPQWLRALGRAEAALAAAGGGTFEAALETLDEAHELAPYDWRMFASKAELYNQWAQFGRQRSQAALLLCEALDFARQATKLHSFQRAESQLVLGKTLARLGHLDKAVEPLRRAMDDDQYRVLAETILLEVNRLARGPRKERPPVVRCARVE